MQSNESSQQVKKSVGDIESFRSQHSRRNPIVDEPGNWQNELKKIKRCNQRQDSTQDQLKDLITIANRFGFYDAADFIKSCVKEHIFSNIKLSINLKPPE